MTVKTVPSCKKSIWLPPGVSRMRRPNSPAFVTTAFAMGGVGVGEGSSVAIKVSRFSGAMVAVGRGVRVGVGVGSRATPAVPLVTK